MDSQIYDPNIFPDQPSVGSDSASYPTELPNDNPGAAPQMPYTIGSGVTRGDQTLGGTLTIANADGSSIVLGAVPASTTNQYGISVLSANGSITQRTIGETIFIDDTTTGKNVIQIGLLPDGTYGLAIAEDGFNVADGFN